MFSWFFGEDDEAEYEWRIDDRRTPTLSQIGEDRDWIDVSVGVSHVVALKGDGSLWAWGWNEHGQLGDGTTETRYEPVRVEFPMMETEPPTEPQITILPGPGAQSPFIPFYARSARLVGSYDRTVLQYPLMIRSMDDLIEHQWLYRDVYIWKGWASEPINEHFFGGYTETFFENQYLVIFNISEQLSSSIGYQVDMVVADGNIGVTRSIPTGVILTDMADWRFILELDNSMVPEQFHVSISDEVR